MSAVFQQEKCLCAQQNESKSCGIGLTGDEEKRNCGHIQKKRHGGFCSAPYCLIPALQRQQADAPEDFRKDAGAVDNPDIGRRLRQRKETDGLNRVGGALTEKGQKQQQCRGAVQKSKKLIPETGMGLMLLLLGEGQQLIDGN